MTGASLSSLIVRALLGMVPVVCLLIALRYLDSFKLVRARRIAIAIGTGALVAFLCYWFNGIPLHQLPREWAVLGAPVLEEIGKAACVYFLLRTHRIGFMVDGAIYGFAIGTGFALFENFVYLRILAESPLFIWVMRGLGTAVMHSGTTAIVGVIAASLSERRQKRDFVCLLPGLVVAMLIHISFNSGMTGPAVTVAATLVVVPTLLYFAFTQSEKGLERWMSEELDQELELLSMIAMGEFASTHAGSYLRKMRDTFPPEVVGDMFCYVQTSLELNLRAKGDLIKREAGFEPEADEELRSKLQELEFLEQSIGKAGLLAISPLLSSSSRNVWQLRQLAESVDAKA
jgi:RsiW-degrading membrane proteinase PrsW (M82 family)